MLTITIKANVPAADAQGIKERIAMDIERYGDCKVMSIVSDRGREEQMTMEGDRHAKNQPEEDHEGTNAQHVGNGVAGQCRGQRGDRRAK